MSLAHVDAERIDLDAIVRLPLRRRSRGRAALNLFGIPLLIIAGLLWLAGVRP